VILIVLLRCSFHLLFWFLFCCFNLNYGAVLWMIFILEISFKFIDWVKFCKYLGFDLLIINSRMNEIDCQVKKKCFCFLRCWLVRVLCDRMKSLTSCMEIQFQLLIVHLLSLRVSHWLVVCCLLLNVLSIILDLFKPFFHYCIKNL